MAEILCSVVIPVYNEELVVAESYRRLKSVMEPLGIPYELIFVNDGSRDRTADILSGICKADMNVKLIDFSRNFGHQIAITAGMDYSCGETVVIIDADLQDPPELIPEMVEKWREGFDVVYGIRVRREGETYFKKITSMLFYRLLKKVSDVDMPLDTGDFRLVDRKVCDALKKVNERNRYVRGLISWLGFRQTGIEYTRDKRFAGETKYPLKKMLRFACDGIASFSYKPLKLAAWCGYAITAGCVAYLLIALIIGNFSEGSPTQILQTPAVSQTSTISPASATLQTAAESLAAAIPQTAAESPAAAIPQTAAESPAAAIPQTAAESPAAAVPQTATESLASTTLQTAAESPAAIATGINLYLALSLLIEGILLISVGIVGAYIGRIYDEVKARPLYIVSGTKNIDTSSDAALNDRRAVRYRENKDSK